MMTNRLKKAQKKKSTVVKSQLLHLLQSTQRVVETMMTKKKTEAAEAAEAMVLVVLAAKPEAVEVMGEDYLIRWKCFSNYTTAVCHMRNVSLRLQD